VAVEAKSPDESVMVPLPAIPFGAGGTWFWGVWGLGRVECLRLRVPGIPLGAGPWLWLWVFEFKSVSIICGLWFRASEFRVEVLLSGFGVRRGRST